MPTARPRSAGRETVLAALRESTAALTVKDIADQVGLHPNTIRGHLDLLTHLGLVTREAERRTVRGRPRIFYRAVGESPAEADAYRTLATLLASELSMVATPGQEAADQAGATWAQSLVTAGRLTPTPDPDAAVDAVAQLFDQLGFATATEPLGDRLYLQQCPYAAARSSIPSVCELHLGLLRGALAATDSGVQVTSLDVEPRPGLCVAHLQAPCSTDPEDNA